MVTTVLFQNALQSDHTVLQFAQQPLQSQQQLFISLKYPTDTINPYFLNATIHDLICQTAVERIDQPCFVHNYKGWSLSSLSN